MSYLFHNWLRVMAIGMGVGINISKGINICNNLGTGIAINL